MWSRGWFSWSRPAVVFLGDSNSGGKIKFGTERGTLGSALPGSNIFCPAFGDLPPPESAVYNGVSDVAISIRKNDLKDESGDPDALINGHVLIRKNYYTSISCSTRILTWNFTSSSNIY